MLARMIVFAIPLALVGFAVWLVKSSRAERAETREALATMARTLEAMDEQPSGSLTGRLNGRAVSIREEWVRGSDARDRCIRMTVEATPGTASLELLRQRSALRASFSDGVQTGDQAFDREFLIRSDNGGRVQQVLTPDVRRQLLEQQWLGELRVRDGQLQCMGGVGFLRKTHVEEAMKVLHLMVRIADGLR